MAFLGTLVNTFGGRWFDMDWKPQLTSQPWEKAITFYVDLMKADGPPGARRMASTKTRLYLPAASARSGSTRRRRPAAISNPKVSQVAAKVGFAKAPIAVTPNGAAWAWSWALAIPTSTKKEAVAKDFVHWATSKDYVKLVGDTEGWVPSLPARASPPMTIPTT